MNRKKQLLILVPFFAQVILASSDFRPGGDTTLKKIYQVALDNYQKGLQTQEAELKKSKRSKSVDFYNSADPLLCDVGGVIFSVFQELDDEDKDKDKNNDLEPEDTVDKEGLYNEHTLQNLGLVRPTGRGFVYQMKVTTYSGKAVLLRFLIDKNSHVQAKQAFTKHITTSSPFKNVLEKAITEIHNQNLEKTIIEFNKVTSKQNFTYSEIEGYLPRILQYCNILDSVQQEGSLSKFANVSGKELLFLKYFEIINTKDYADFKALIYKANKEEHRFAAFMNSDCRQALLNFLKKGDFIDKLLLPSLAALGVVDVFLTVAKVFNPGLDNSQYNYAHVIKVNDDESLSSVKATNFTHPNLPNPIENSFNFERSESSLGASITGMNGSGKSIAMKALLLNIILGQTLGIVRAKEFLFTPYHYIGLHANVSDTDERSRFSNELKLIEEFLKHANSPLKGRLLLLFDEPFSSTNANDAYQILFAYIQFLSKYQQVSAHFITHIQKIVEMSQLKPWGSAVTQNPDGTYNKKYYLVPSSSLCTNAIIEMFKVCGPVFQQIYEKQFGKIIQKPLDTIQTQSEDTKKEESVV